MQILSNLSVSGLLGLSSVADANTDTDKFLVLDSSGIVRYRTGAELYSDIGAGGAAAYTSVLQHTVKAGVALTKGQAVYVSSADGTNMIVSKASNASEQTSSKTLGLIAQNLAQNDQGFVVTEGLLAGLDTSTANAGDPVWLGTDGNLIYGLGAKPYAPDHLVFIGIVTRAQQNNGEIFVKVQNGFELNELHNVQITSTPSDSSVLSYETSTSLYKMKSIPTLLGYTPVTDARTLTINGTSYNLSSDRAWSIDTGVMTASAGLGISLSIVNQNLNIINTGILTASAGLGISLSVVNQNLNVINTGILTASAGSGISLSVVNQNLNVINTGILTASAGSGISLSVVGQNLNVINTGVLTASAGAGISLSIVGGNLNVINTITNNNQLTNGAGYITSAALSGYVQGSGSSGQVTYWSGSSTQTGTNNFFWDASNSRLGVGTNNPQRVIEIYSTTADSHLRISGAAPSVSLGEANTGSLYQAKFGLATVSGHYASASVPGDFVIISQTASILWVTNTTEKMRVTNAGFVGIGTTGPAERLTVASGNFRLNGANANSRFIVYQDYSNSAVGVQLFNTSGVSVIDLNGNAGNINISGSITGAKGFFSSSAATDSTTAILGNASTNDSTTFAAIFGSLNAGYRMHVRGDGQLRLHTYTSSSSWTGTATAFLAVDSSGNVITTSGGSSQWVTSGSDIYYNTGNVGIATTNPTSRLTIAPPNVTNASSIEFTATDNAAISAYYSLTFAVNNSNTQAGRTINFSRGGKGYGDQASTMMVIQADTGRVGIGTTSPTHLLSLSRSVEAAAYQININSEGGISTGNFTGIRFSQDSTASTELGNIRLHYFSSGATALSLGTRYATQAIYIDNTTDGKVGINTTTPNARLHVYGSGTVSRFESSTSNSAITISHTANGGLIGYSNQGPTANLFYVTTGSGVIGGGITMDNNGYLGIGTSSPSNAMTTSGVTIGNLGGTYGFIELSSNDSLGYGPWIDFTQATGSDYGGRIRYWSADNKFYFYTNASGTANVTFGPSNVGIGTTSPSYKLHVYTSDNEGIYLQGTGGGIWMNIKSAAGKMWSYGAQNDGCGIYNRTDGVYRMFIADSGAATFSSSITCTSLTETSTIKVKENIVSVDSALEQVEKLQAVSYNRKGSSVKEIGLIAEAVEEVYPEFVQYDQSGEPVGINYSRLTAVLIESVKELKNRITELEKRN